MIDGKFKLLFVSILLYSSFIGNTYARQTNDVKFLILEDSKLRINGTSNVTDFQCIYKDRISADTLNQSITFGDTLTIRGDKITINVSSLDCGKRVINRDLQKTLKANEYPFLELNLLTVEISDTTPFNALLEITIAEVTQNRFIEVTSFKNSTDHLVFSGSGKILLSDFGLDPPTALFGLIKVDNEIEIMFDLIIAK